MKYFIILIFFISTILSNDTMVWFCLEICDNKTQIMEQIKTINQTSRKALNLVSFEKYTLSSNLKFVRYGRNLTEVNEIFKKIDGAHGIKLKTFPMITSKY
jgi:1-aminocyclopropane-1-carboxylate deaminase/D-cysteine desulfhydrase-like pyridoxal-dependent ACC family enzyme